ncbi:MAG TPA: DsbA family protein [Solirubrobacteraceae bacterium]
MTTRFYYDLSSPFAYLAAHRVDDVVPGDVEWVPIAFGPLLVQTGRVPWSLKPGREVNMQECERRAQRMGLPPIRWPEAWPAESYSVNPARAALFAKRQGKVREMSRALYAEIFGRGRRLDDPATVEAAASAAGVDGVAEGIAEVKAELREQTEDAIARGIVGLPRVEVGGAIFGGDARLEEAAARAAA